MKLKKIAITNYRQFQNAVINFDDELTILAGANNSGKTSIIELFKRIFKDKNFSKEDISAEYYSKLQYDFISCINKIYNITDKETEFRENVKKEFSIENNNKWTVIKIKIEVQYDKNESISLFSDYLMELSDTCTSFFFLFNYEVNITELNKLLSLNATNLLDKKHEIQKLEAGRKTNKTRIKLTELQAEYEEFLKEIFDGALENRVYFADQNYENAGQISVREFQSLFNYNYLNATRLLNDEKTDNYFSISKELLSHFKKSNDWEEFKKQIIKDIKEGLKEQKLNEKVKEHSLIKAQNALDSIEKCFEYNKVEFSLQTDISDELLLGFLSSSLQTFFEFENGTKLKEFSQGLGISNQDDDLRINYRCSSNIVGILNNLYNDEKFFQQPNKSSGKVNPTIVITNDFSESFMEQFKDYMQLYLFNRERFEKIGASDLYSALSDMKAYKFPSQYTPVDVLTDTTNDNPDKLFRILFCVCDFIKMVSMAAYGKSIQFAREKKQIFNSGFTNIEFHNDKIIFYDKVQKLEEAYDLSTMTIQGFCEFLTDNEYCNKDIFLPFIEDTEYEKVLKVSLSQLHALYAYLGAPSVSTQHGVKGEGHNNVCFIAEDSTRNPIVYMYEFFQLLCAEDINLTDFQNFYYDYVSEIKSINLTYLKPAKTYKAHEGEYLQYAQYIKNKYKDNKYFLFCQQKYYDKYLGNPNSTNAKDCFKSTKIQGILWAYKLFYVGCSRAKENLVIVIDENKIAPFRKEFIKRMTAIGFDVNGI